MTDSAIDVALVVVTHDSGDHIGGFLSSLDASLGDLSSRLIVVDNASTDDTVARLRDDGRAELVIRPDNPGYAAAINVAVTRSREASAVLVLNPDLVLGPASVPALLAAAQAPRVGIVVPQMRTPDGAVYPSLRREPTIGRALGTAIVGGRRAQRFPRLCETIGDDRSYRERHDVDWATGAAMLVTRACADATGAWDESFFLYSEETDYAERARRAGFRVVYEPSAVVTHVGGESMTSPRLRSMLTVNRVRYYRRRHGPAAGAAFYAAVLTNEVVRGALGDRAARAAARALLWPRARPRELGCSDRLVPR